MIGDVLVSSIICNNLKKAYPNSEIHYMVYNHTTPVVVGNPNIDKFILFKEEHRKSKLQLFRFIRSIRRERYDLIIDAYSKLESWLTVLFSGAKRKISYHKKGRTFLYTDTIKMQTKARTNLGLTIERRLSLLSPLNLKIKLDPIPRLYITNDEKVIAKNLLSNHEIDRSKKLIMVSILGSSSNKTYPLNYISKVVDFIAINTGASMLFNYIPNQMDDAKYIYDSCNDSTKSQIYFDVLGGSLREYIALMNECDFIIGNDGGAINIAKSLNKPSFIIFSPWIEKNMWATFEDGKFHKSVHLQDYKPELFIGKSEKELKKESLNLYEQFDPELFYEELKSFLNFNVSNEPNKLMLDEISIIESSNIKKNKLTALVITLNEAETIESLIENLNFADEIIIIDSFSSDTTAKVIGECSNVKFIQRKFSNFSDQRNFAIEQAGNDWIMFIDADERITEDLKREIEAVVKDTKDIIAYEIHRNFFFKNKRLKFSGFQTDKTFRLFNKNYARYDDQKFVHETLIVSGKTKVLKNRLDHFSFKNRDDYKRKMEIYATLRAQELFKKGLKPNFYHFKIKPVYRFFYHYIIRLGFLDGECGFVISKLNSYSVKQRYIELQNIYDSSN